MITHVVLFWLNNPGNVADRAELAEGIRTLGAIDVVRSCEVGFPAGTEARGSVDHSFDVSEILKFDSLEDQLAYQRDPIHLAFVEKYRRLWDHERIYDITAAG